MQNHIQEILTRNNLQVTILILLAVLSLNIVHYIGFTLDFPGEWPLRLAHDLAPALASDLTIAFVVSAGITKLSFEAIKHLVPALVSPLLLIKKVRKWTSFINSNSRAMKGIHPGFYVGVFWATFAEIYLGFVDGYYALLFLVILVAPMITFPYVFTLRLKIMKNRFDRESRELGRGRFNGYLLPALVFSNLLFVFIVGIERFHVVTSQESVEIETANGSISGIIISQINGGLLFASPERRDRNGYPEIRLFKGDYSISTAKID